MLIQKGGGGGLRVCPGTARGLRHNDAVYKRVVVCERATTRPATNCRATYCRTRAKLSTGYPQLMCIVAIIQQHILCVYVNRYI